MGTKTKDTEIKNTANAEKRAKVKELPKPEESLNEKEMRKIGVA